MDTHAAAQLLVPDTWACLEGPPEGARFERFFEASWKGQLVFVFSHPDWEEVEEDSEIPRHSVAVRRALALFVGMEDA